MTRLRSLTLRTPEAATLARTGRVEVVREVKPQPTREHDGLLWFWRSASHAVGVASMDSDRELPALGSLTHLFPQWAKGQRLRVREPWALLFGEDFPDGTPNLVYRAHRFNSTAPTTGVDRHEAPRAIARVAAWHSAATMPLAFSRATVEVEAVRVEQEGGVWRWRVTLAACANIG